MPGNQLHHSTPGGGSKSTDMIYAASSVSSSTHSPISQGSSLFNAARQIPVSEYLQRFSITLPLPRPTYYTIFLPPVQYCTEKPECDGYPCDTSEQIPVMFHHMIQFLWLPQCVSQKNSKHSKHRNTGSSASHSWHFFMYAREDSNPR